MCECGKSIIPQITMMMGDVLKALSLNVLSLALQQAYSKVVSTMEIYTIDPISFQRKREGSSGLTNPLFDVLVGIV